ncbi:MAG TPA: acetamidase/formamidase family protein [Bryobacteraceae bacterium]|nr:acetamidase/formamidase family protein [Bryobacteraceae bacterium]
MRYLLALSLVLSSCIAATESDFDLAASPSTVAWGYYSAQAKPVLMVHSGDTVRMHTVSTCSLEKMEAGGVPHNTIPQYDRDIHEQVKDKGPGGHILTGPVEIAEAEPGDVLEVQIEKIDIDVPYACNGFGPGRGFLPNDFPYARTKVIPLDLGHMTAKFGPGINIPLHPFFGSMGVAPPSGGKLNSGPPWMHAGNMDNKELVAGTTLYIPVHAKGALFEAGDGHAGQGNGEVDITALETWLTGTFKFIVHKDQHLLWPRGETPTSYIAMGFDEDLKTATELAVRNMIDFLVTEKHLTRDDAYALTSVAVDVDITQLVDGKVGVHAMCPKNIFNSE